MAVQCYEALGDTDGARSAARKAVERLEKSIAREPDNGSLLAYGVNALSVLGEAVRAQDWAKQAILIDPNDGLLRYNLACAMTRLGEIDAALAYLEAALELRPRRVHWARNDSDFDRLRTDPRFEELMAKAEAEDKADIPDGMSILEELARREERLRKIAEARATIEARAKERHALEMAEGARLTFEIDLSKLPVIEGSEPLAVPRFHTRASKSNREFVEGRLVTDPGIDPLRLEYAFDAQTSGGLLAALAPGSEAGTGTVIGRLQQGHSGAVLVN